MTMTIFCMEAFFLKAKTFAAELVHFFMTTEFAESCQNQHPQILQLLHICDGDENFRVLPDCGRSESSLLKKGSQ